MCQNKLFLLQKRQVSCRDIYGIAEYMFQKKKEKVKEHSFCKVNEVEGHQIT